MIASSTNILVGHTFIIKINDRNSLPLLVA